MGGGGFDDPGRGKVRDKGALDIRGDRIAARLFVKIGREIEQRIFVRNVEMGKLPGDVRGRLPRDLALVDEEGARGRGGHTAAGGMDFPCRKISRPAGGERVALYSDLNRVGLRGGLGATVLGRATAGDSGSRGICVLPPITRLFHLPILFPLSRHGQLYTAYLFFICSISGGSR